MVPNAIKMEFMENAKLMKISTNKGSNYLSNMVLLDVDHSGNELVEVIFHTLNLEKKALKQLLNVSK